MDAPCEHDSDGGANETGSRGLMVLAGDQVGSHYPLKSPATLLGFAPACDIRTPVRATRALHCLLVPNPDSVSIRNLHAEGATINGKPFTSAVMREGDVLEIGSQRFRLDWPAEVEDQQRHDALRIHAAAMVAQQAALSEQEALLNERTIALSQQESQIADRLEEQRRQLLDLQDQITTARSQLRRKRSEHANLVADQQRELTVAREAALNLQRSAKSERERLIALRRRMIQRGRKHWQARRKVYQDQSAKLQKDLAQFAAEKSALERHYGEAYGAIELEKRRLKEAWERLNHSKNQWQAKHAHEESTAQERTRDLARRAKAVAAGERKLENERAQVERELVDRRKELEQLETRITNGRALLLRTQPEPFKLAPPGVPVSSPSTAIAVVSAAPIKDIEQRETAIERRAASLDRVSDELADQRLHLAEQAERLLRTQEQWHADRNEALRELETIGVRFQARELDLDRRVRELGAARARMLSEYESLAQMKLRLEAEQARRASTDSDRRAELDARWAELDVRERALASNEASWRSLLRLWGRRRWREVLQLRSDQDACREARAEWINARRIWLRNAARMRDERRIVAAQALALEHWRMENAGAAERPAAAKRLERLERQWASQCAIAARELERFQDSLSAEALRLDEYSDRLRRDALDLAARSAAIDQRAGEIERQQQSLGAEHERLSSKMELARIRWEAAERRALDLRDEVERVARLLIDSGPMLALPTGQAA